MTITSRRAYLHRASMLSMAGAAAPWTLNLAALSEAAAATATDYKALVATAPSNHLLADEYARVMARKVSTAAEVGARRQVFFVSLGGFDTHAG